MLNRLGQRATVLPRHALPLQDLVGYYIRKTAMATVCPICARCFDSTAVLQKHIKDEQVSLVERLYQHLIHPSIEQIDTRRPRALCEGLISQRVAETLLTLLAKRFYSMCA